jgi:hypothetical protein
MKKFEIFLLTAVLYFLLFGIYFARTNPAYFKDVYAAEDGLAESLTALALFAGAVVWLVRFVRLRRVRPKCFLAGTLLFAMLYLFGTGEEISWGQRIFGIESPEFFVTHNAQGETNLHNLIVSGVKINKLIFGAALAVCIVTYLLALPILYRKSPAARALVDRFAVPVPQVRHVLCYVALFGLVSLIPSSKKGELLELGGCCLFLLITLYPFNGAIFKPGVR